MSNNNTQPNYLNKKQSQWVYDTVVGTKEHYGTPGTFAFACLAAVLSIGPKGLHIKSIEGLTSAVSLLAQISTCHRRMDTSRQSTSTSSWLVAIVHLSL